MQKAMITGQMALQQEVAHTWSWKEAAVTSQIWLLLLVCLEG